MKRATTHWRTRRKHRVSSEWINNRMALVRSKYCQNTLPLPFDPLRLIFLSHRGSFVLINIVSLHVSLAKRRACEYPNTRIVPREEIENGVASQFHNVVIIINGLHMKRLKILQIFFLPFGKKWTIVT